MNQPLRWGVLGTGGIARTFANDLRQTTSGAVTAVGSRMSESANRYGDDFEVAYRFGSYEELVACDKIDVVYVATPHSMHHANTLLALRAGKHALVEKAFTMNAVEARDLVDTARRSELFLMEAMWTRFLPHVAAIQRLIADGALGQIYAVSADHGQWFASDPTHRLFAPELGGGALLDLGVYCVLWASMLLGTPSRIRAAITSAFTGVDGETSMLFEYESGAQALLACSSLARTATRSAIVGTDARIEVDGNFYSPTSFMLIPRDGEPVRYAPPVAGRGGWLQSNEVARCIGAGLLESPLMLLDETVSIMQTMDTVLAGGQ